jgi:hypothetical protein
MRARARAARGIFIKPEKAEMPRNSKAKPRRERAQKQIHRKLGTHPALFHDERKNAPVLRSLEKGWRRVVAILPNYINHSSSP